MTHDCVIIGGGPAGLNAALVLGRARKSVVVIDEGRARNRVTRETHGFLTRDSISPSEFRRIAKEQISAYPSVTFCGRYRHIDYGNRWRFSNYDGSRSDL